MNRARRWLPLVVLLALLGFVVEVGMARANGKAGKVGEGLDQIPVAEPYRAGPLEHRPSEPSIELPSGAEELLALAVLAAILYGFRASGLARQGREERAPASSDLRT